MVADARAETPTAAADMAVMNTFELRDTVDYFKEQLLISANAKIEAERQILNSRKDLLLAGIKAKISEASSMVDKALIILKENDPRNVFSKGYAAVISEDGIIIPDVSSIRSGDTYTIKMKSGSFRATASDIKTETEF